MKARTSSRSAGWAKVTDAEAAEMRADVLAEAADLAQRASDHYRATAQPDRARVTGLVADHIQKAGGEGRG